MKHMVVNGIYTGKAFPYDPPRAFSIPDEGEEWIHGGRLVHISLFAAHPVPSTFYDLVDETNNAAFYRKRPVVS